MNEDVDKHIQAAHRFEEAAQRKITELEGRKGLQAEQAQIDCLIINALLTRAVLHATLAVAKR
jgi:hypothetical protein